MSDDGELERSISTRQAAVYLGCSVRHVERLISSGVLRAWDVSLPTSKRQHWVVMRESIRELLEGRVSRTPVVPVVSVAGPRDKPGAG